MPHDVSLIATIASAFGLALILGFVAAKLRMPPVVGYLLAGVMIGPATPGFVADVGLAGQLAEIGVMLLMFGVGLHFSFEDLLAVRRIAVPGAIVQMAVAVALGMGTAMSWGWSLGGALVLHGDATRQIISQEENYDCDLIVMGKHGTRVTEEPLPGSVTNRVLAESCSDVLVVVDARALIDAGAPA